MSSRRFAQLLAEASGAVAGDRFIDLVLSVRVTRVDGVGPQQARWVTEGEGDEDTLLTIGGRWDRQAHAWTDTPISECKPVVLRVIRGGAQERAARWLARWFTARITGDWEAAGMMRDCAATRSRVRSAWSLLLLGGRRSGKSHIAVAALVIFLVMVPECVVWAISPTIDETAELEAAIRKMLPSTWYGYRGAGAGKVTTFTLAHGGKLLLLSGFKAAGLRRGRVDLALYNEGQNMSHKGYTQIRAPIADSGGLVIVAANPPEQPIGRWVEEMVEGAARGHAGVPGGIDAVHIDFDPEENPFIDMAALRSMAAELDEDTYDRDVRGLLKPIGDVVFPSYSERDTRKPVRPGLVDVTREVTKTHLGKPFDHMVGMDFQRLAAMAAVVLKFFRDPADDTADILCWAMAEAVVADATEADLVDALEHADRWEPTGYRPGAGYKPEECGVVMDASGWWQDGAHNKGKTSDLTLQAAGWKNLWRPQKDSKVNPDILERVKTGNARLKTKDGRRHLFVDPSCKHLAQALKRWENKHGVPYRKSKYAHAADALTYPLYRVFGRPKTKQGETGYVSVSSYTRAAEIRDDEGDDDA